MLFTPGLPGGSKGRHMSRLFPAAKHIRFSGGGADAESGDHSAQTLSSISSVSIIASEPVQAANADVQERDPPSVAAAPSRPMAPESDSVKERHKRPSLSKSLIGFLTSLAGCARNPGPPEVVN